MEYLVDPKKLMLKLSTLEQEERLAYINESIALMMCGGLEAGWAEKAERQRKKKDVVYTDEFNEFWSLYPSRKGVKAGKATAAKAWHSTGIDEKQLLAMCKEALSKQVKSEQWVKNNGTFIPMASTYLNNCRWEDEVSSEDFSNSSDLMSQFGIK